MNLVMTLKYLRPGEEWTLDGDSYDGLTWLADTAKPSVDDLEAAYPAAQAAFDAEAAAKAQARADAVTHAKSLGFTDAMIADMFPNVMMEA